ncbi:60S ribosomal protein L27, mitochondrial [Sporothrix bragantina]|uniref:60S ribosomal protein L27, mitochondrial n=1 Tax=Sporothrix bragantina TaxID=671064 RepID=A0ABP0C429_9PEZI
MRATDILLRPYRKLRLTVKDVNKGFYKGTRTGSMGRHTKKGGYIVEYEKVRTYVVPSLVDFNLTPFISKRVRATFGVYPEAAGEVGQAKGPRSPALYLARWKAENGLD